MLQGFFTNCICTCGYILVVIYCIYKERMLIMKHPDVLYCDTLVAGWLKFEIRILFTWLASCSLFLLYGSCIRFESKWKSVEEQLELQNIWGMKDAQDYLHHMKFEQECYNLITGPLLADLYSFVSVYERSAAGLYDTDFWAILSYFICRLAALIGFFYQLGHPIHNKAIWMIGYVSIFGFYLIGLGLTVVALNSENVDHIAIRKCTMLSECFSLFWLFLYTIYLYYYLRDMKAEVTKKSLELFGKRAQEFDQLLKEAEEVFLQEHNQDIQP